MLIRSATVARAGAAGRRTNGLASVVTVTMSWLMVLMSVVPGNLDFYTGGASSEGSEGNPVTRFVWIAIFVCGSALAMGKWTMTRRILRNTNVFFLLLTGLAFVSLAWSIDPELTVRKLLRMSMMLAAFLAIATAAWHRRRFQDVLRPVMTFVVLMSIGLAIALPDVAIHHEPQPELNGAWRGICLSKNQLGAVASFAFLFWAHAWLTGGSSRWRAAMAIAACGLCLVKTRSETSIIATTFSCLAMYLLLKTPPTVRRHIPLSIGIFVGSLVLFCLAMLHAVPGLDVLLAPIPMITGKDLTFSNRAPIWAAVMEHVRRHPVLGSGYGAFWVPVPTPESESYFVIARAGFYPGSSHNGYLQVLNDLGSVGLFLLLGFIVTFLREALSLFRLERAQGAVYVGLLLQQLVENLQEPSWFNAMVVDYLPISVATFCLARNLLEARQAQALRRAALPPGQPVPRSGVAEARPRLRLVRRH